MSSRATRLARFSSVTSPNSTDVPVPREFLGPAVGAPAPDFTLRDQFGQDVTLSSFVGSKAVALVFFPWAFSNVCSSEMDGIRDRLDEFLTFDTEVLAISTDPTYSLRVFSDRDGLRRSSFVLDKGGIVRWSVHNELPQGRDLGDHLAQLHHLA
jgi:mycoredoxin-dependent peroxiredoxin